MNVLKKLFLELRKKTKLTDDVSNHNIGFVASMSLEGI